MAHFPDNPPPPLPLDTDAAEPPVVIREGVPIWVLVVVSLSLAVLCGAGGWAAGFITGAALEYNDDYVYIENVDLTIESPASVAPGEAFAIVVTLTNNGDTPQTINTIDLYDTYLAGVTIESSSPAWTDTTHEDNYRTYSYPNTIAAGASLTIKLNAVAGDKPGVYADDLEVWFVEGNEYVYDALETTVK